MPRFRCFQSSHRCFKHSIYLSDAKILRRDKVGTRNKKRVTWVPGGGTHIFFRTGRAVERGIIFRIPTPGQGIIFVQRSSMTGSIFVIFDSERSF